MWDWLPSWEKEKFERIIGNRHLHYKERGWGYEQKKRRDRVDFAHSKHKREHSPLNHFEALKERWKFPVWKKKSRRHFDE